MSSPVAIPDVDLNGPTVVGLAALGDKALPVEKRVHVCVDAMPSGRRLALAFKTVQWGAGISNKDKAQLDVCLAVVVMNGWHGIPIPDAARQVSNRAIEQCGDVVFSALAPANALVDNPDGHDDVMARIDAIRARLTDEQEVGRAALILMSTKVNWFQTNHHVGQEGIQGFSGKVAKVVFGESPGAALTSEIHRLGHFVSTPLAMEALFTRSGVRGPELHEMKLECRSAVAMPEPTRDIVLRMGAYPAGTAKVGFTIAAFRYIAGGVYAAAVAGLTGLDALRALDTDIRANPLRYHVGANYLLGVSPSKIEALEEEHLATASVYVHVVMEKSTLAQAKVMMNADDAAAIVQVTHAAMTAIKRRLVTKRVSSEQLDAIVASAGTVADGNELAGFVAAGRAFDVAGAITRAQAATDGAKPAAP